MAVRAKNNQNSRRASAQNVLKVLHECTEILKALRESTKNSESAARVYECFESAARCESAKILNMLREPSRSCLQQAMRETAENVNFAARALADNIFGMREVTKKSPSSLRAASSRTASSKMNARAVLRTVLYIYTTSTHTCGRHFLTDPTKSEDACCVAIDRVG